MKFEDKELGASFSLPDKPTLKQYLQYDSMVEVLGNGRYLYERLWAGLQVLAQGWQCETCPLDIDLDSAGVEALPVIKWAGLACWSYMQAQKELPKN